MTSATDILDALHPEPAAAGAKKRYVLLVRGGTPPARHLHAAGILILPAVAAAICAWYVWSGQVAVWQPVLALTMFAVTMLGVTVGFHRLLSHRAFQAGPALRGALAIAGSMAAQGPVIYWVSNHRRHHRFSDDDGDPHSPHQTDERELEGWRGFWHAHVGWTFTHDLTNSAYVARDLLRDPVIRWVNRRYAAWVLAGLVIPGAIGAALDGARGAWLGILWGGGMRLFLSYHLTNSINSITHMYGYRSYATPEQSHNNVWLGLPTFGEGWHNNHHAWPSSAFFGFTWWEIDPGGAVIRVLEWCGLVWNVRRPDGARLDRRSVRQQR